MKFDSRNIGIIITKIDAKIERKINELDKAFDAETCRENKLITLGKLIALKEFFTEYKRILNES